MIVGYDGWLEWPDPEKPDVVDTDKIDVEDVVWPGDLYAQDVDSIILARRGGVISLHNVASGEQDWQRTIWTGSTTIRSAAVSRNGTHVAVGATSGLIEIIDGRTGESIGEPLDKH